MTAMPPTTGHLQLIQFAKLIGNKTDVIVCTQPHEPMVNERVNALISACMIEDVTVHHIPVAMEQDPATDGFWDMWIDIMKRKFGFLKGDCIVASEPYGQKLASLLEGFFFPYDIDRSLNHVRATFVRMDPLGYYSLLLPQFRRKHFRTRVTVFGAESCGKTTLSKALAASSFYDAHWLWEWARPYLEQTGDDITVQSMMNIWKGQLALQLHVDNIVPKPLIFQDTDLFSTVGYWRMWESELGPCPDGLIQDARLNASNLYIVAPSNIPFVPDALRYGGDVRESLDQYWIDLLNEFNLPHIVLKNDKVFERTWEAMGAVDNITFEKNKLLEYDRQGL